MPGKFHGQMNQAGYSPCMGSQNIGHNLATRRTTNSQQYHTTNFKCAKRLDLNSRRRRRTVRLFVTPWTVVHQAPLPMGFSRQEYWSGLLLPSPGDLPDPGWNPGLLYCRRILYLLSHREAPVIGCDGGVSISMVSMLRYIKA